MTEPTFAEIIQGIERSKAAMARLTPALEAARAQLDRLRAFAYCPADGRWYRLYRRKGRPVWWAHTRKHWGQHG